MTEHRTVEAHTSLSFRDPLVALGLTKAIVRQSQTSSPPSPEKSAYLGTPIVSAAYKPSLTNRGGVMMRAMRAESFTGYGALKLVEVPKPILADGRVLVRITAAGVTPLDHTILSGGYPPATAPLILGNEGAGVVDDPGDSSFPVGARVMFTGPYGVFEDGTYSE